MIHLRYVSKGAPAQAADFQEIICMINSFLVALLSSFGASSPLLNFIAEKCDLPET